MSEARPGEEAAWAGEIPRTKPPRQLPPGARRAIIAAALVVGVAMVGWVILKFPGARAP